MNEPQVWTLIGVFAAGLFGMITLMSTMFVRIVRTEIGSVRSEIRTKIGSVRSEIRTEIGSVRGELGSLRSEMQSEFRGMHQRIDRLDSDVNALMKHTFGIQRD